MMTLLWWWLCYMSKRIIWTSACVAKPISASCSWRCISLPIKYVIIVYITAWTSIHKLEILLAKCETRIWGISPWSLKSAYIRLCYLPTEFIGVVIISWVDVLCFKINTATSINNSRHIFKKIPVMNCFKVLKWKVEVKKINNREEKISRYSSEIPC